MANQSYSITQADVDAYLDSKKDSEPIGVTCDGYNCLLAEALAYKYAGDTFNVGLYGFCLNSATNHHSYSHDLDHIVSDFDALVIDSERDEHEWPITKAQWLRAMQASVPESEASHD